jgi:hypothetical protein
MPRYVCPMLDTASLAPPGEDKGCGMPDGHMDIDKASGDKGLTRSKRSAYDPNAGSATERVLLAMGLGSGPVVLVGTETASV